MQKRRIKILLAIAAFCAACLIAQPVLAEVDIGAGYAQNIGLGAANPKDIIVGIIRVILGFLGLLAIILIMYGGFVWMTSGGDASKVERARKILIAAVIGLLIVLASWGIVFFILSRMQGITNPCTDGDTVECGCGNMGTKTCVGEIWGPCEDDCNANCCRGICQVEPCNPALDEPFRVTNTSPYDGQQGVVLNKVIRFSFNAAVSSSSVTDTTFTVTDAANNPIAGVRRAAGGRIEFRGSDPCPANACNAVSCLPLNTDIIVTAVGGAGASIRSQAGETLDCTVPNICRISFRTGSVVDCEDPDVGFSFDQLCAGPATQIDAWSQDDGGIDYLDFFVNGGLIGSANNPLPSPGAPFNASQSWDSSAIAPGTRINLRVTAYDVDDNTASDEETATLRPAHCCNGEMDATGDPDLIDPGLPELGQDCGGECAACDGAACGEDLNQDCNQGNLDCRLNDDICASRYCNCTASSTLCSTAGYAAGVDNCCVCQGPPTIFWVSPLGGFCNASPGVFCSDDAVCATLSPGDTCNRSDSNGAPGNFITIGGKRFGDARGGVDFSSGGIWVDAPLADDPIQGNPLCQPSVWSDSEIVAVVPGGTAPQPVIRVTEASTGFNYYDTTAADNRGPVIGFRINGINRPGLCGLNPDRGIARTVLDYNGIRLLGVSAQFGDYYDRIPALNPVFIQNQQGTAGVPAIGVGRTTTFVLTPQDVPSNYKSFLKDPEAPAGPRILAFERTSGTIGQYVTIYGQGFGAKKGRSRVCFGADCQTGTEADYTFPEVCSDSVWSDSQVIIKVPRGLSDGQYLLSMELEHWSATINTADLNPARFTVDSNLPLAPSLCRIVPTMGPNLTPVRLWGEYFDPPDSESRISFYLNNINSWNDVPRTIYRWETDPEIETDIAETQVHVNAVTGPVNVGKTGAGFGNGMNFVVGVCSADTDCGEGRICCPQETFNFGRCVFLEEECYLDNPNSVYEWDFSTEHRNGTSTSCRGFATASACLQQTMCPNAPGSCQTDEARNLGACGDAECGTRYPLCAASGCTYDEAAGRCVLDGAACDSYSADILLGYTARCRTAGPSSVWQIENVFGSCPENTYIDPYNRNCTVGTPAFPEYCQTCPAGSSCEDGQCLVGSRLCPAGSSCDAAEGVCRSVSQSCECCCRLDTDLGSDPTQEQLNAQDCCAGTLCEPIGCAQSPAGCDPASDPDCGYGKCTHCRVELDGDRSTVTADEQTASDEACNCRGTNRTCVIFDDEVPPNGIEDETGYCDDRHRCNQIAGDPADMCLPDPNGCDPDEVCGPDCYCYERQRCDSTPQDLNCDPLDDMCNNIALYPYIQFCSTTPPTECLCDLVYCDSTPGDDDCSADDNICTQLDPQAWCDIESCICREPVRCSRSTDPAVCDPSPAVCPDDMPFCDINTCYCTDSPPPLGEECLEIESTFECDMSRCEPFTCLQNDGSPGVFAQDCGVCCCDPVIPLGETVSPGTTLCQQVDPDLECLPDKDGCSGPARGLCCGCTQDIECGNEETTGCGYDTCCHPRPEVTSVFPIDEQEGICRNPLITAEFSENMDLGSYTGHVHLIGYYGTDPCPEGTTYLAKGDLRNSLIASDPLGAAIMRFADGILPAALAYEPIDPAGNYCAVPTLTDGYNDPAGAGILEVAPRIMLDPLRIYYMVLEGQDRGRGVAGIRSIWGVGLRGNDAERISAVTYTNSEIWSFTTGSEICRLTDVRVDPNNYMFQTYADDYDVGNLGSPECQRDDIGDDSGPTHGVVNDIYHRCFDMLNDRDKAFHARASSTQGQPIAPIPGFYAWTWSWNSDNTEIVTVSQIGSSSHAVAEARNVDDNRTYIHAVATISEDNVFTPSTRGERTVGDALITVFLCENPWPTRDASGSWLPWVDDLNNCSVRYNPFVCPSYNFDLYYCRDQGVRGTSDDLPVLRVDSSAAAAISNNPETYDWYPRILSSSTRSNVLKEYLFFQEEAPSSRDAEVRLIDQGDGARVYAEWDEMLAPNNQPAASYKIYIGTSPRNYTQSYTTTNRYYLLTGLTHGRTIYAAVTALSASAAESEYSAEASITPYDITPPAIPRNFVAAAIATGTVRVSWTANTDDTSSYTVYYGSNPGIYGMRQNVGRSTNAVISVSSTTAVYYFTVTATDVHRNESGYAQEIAIVPIPGGAIMSVTFVNEGFESGLPGDVPAGWNRIYQTHSMAGIDNTASYLGGRSLRFQRDPNQQYPGLCSQDACDPEDPIAGDNQHIPGCIWEGGRCRFDTLDNAHIGAAVPIYYNPGDSLSWGNTNHTMFAAVSRELGTMDWQIGETYRVSFYYRGRTDTDIAVRIGYMSGWETQCVPFATSFSREACRRYTGNALDYPDCPLDANACCLHAPVQQRCYSSEALQAVTAGNYDSGPYNGWYFYSDSFTYTSDLDQLRDGSNIRHNQIEILMEYGTTGAGSDFRIDNLVVAAQN